MTSSAAVARMNSSNWRRTVLGDPTKEWRSMLSTCAFSSGVQDDAMSSTGGGMRPPGPRRAVASICWVDVKRRRASESVSAATTLQPTMTYGPSSCAEGSNLARYESSASKSDAGAKWEAKP